MRSKFRKWGLTVVTMASVATLVLLVTGWGSAMASSVQSVIVANTASNPVPVTPTGTVPVHEQGTAKVAEQNLDGNGNVKVHEQGTANVNVTNSSLTVAQPTPITSASVTSELLHITSGTNETDAHPGISVATAVRAHMSAGIAFVGFLNNGHPVATFSGPGNFGSPDVELALTRPIEFDEIACVSDFFTAEECAVDWVGNN